MNNLLEVKNLSKTYYTKEKEIKALDNISFKINKDDYIAIIGPSGSGKSTLLSLLSGNEKETCGNIIKKDNLKIGYMFQSDLLFEWLTVYENCLLGLKISNDLTKENISNVIRLLKKYDLYEFKDNYPKSLSGGMRQRVALIRTLVIKPDILLLDEPFSKLDYQNRLIVSSDVINIIKNEKISLILVTHDINEAIRMCDRIIVFSKRPSVIKKEYIIKNDDYQKYYDMIWNDLYEK